MPDTPSTKYAIARPADNDPINGWPATMRAAIDLIDGLMATAITTDPRPAAAKYGRLHRAADGTISFDTGSAWVEVARHPHAAKHAVGGSDPLTVNAAMLASDIALPNIGDITPTARQTLPGNGRWMWCDGSLIDRTAYPDFFAAVGHTYNGGVDPGGGLVRVPDLRGRVPVGVDGTANRLTVNDALGQTGGEEKHALTGAENGPHTHTDGSLSSASAGTHTHADTFAVANGGAHVHGTATPGYNFAVANGNIDQWPMASALSGAVSGVVVNSGGLDWGANASTSAAGDHGHVLNGAVSSGGAHTHDVTGDTGSAGSGTPHNIMQPFQVVNYLIRIL